MTRSLGAPCLVGIAVLAGAALARADVIPPGYRPPVCESLECPRGSYPAGGGHGSCPNGCAPSSQTCSAESPCSSGYECVPTRWCIEPDAIRGRSIDDAVRGECAPDGTCATGSCVETGRCAPIPAVETTTPVVEIAPELEAPLTAIAVAGCFAFSCVFVVGIGVVVYLLVRANRRR